MPRFVDLADREEDQRIAEIAKALDRMEKVAFITDDEPGKPERYLEKLRAIVPGLVVVFLGKGPIHGTVTVSVKKGDA